MANTDPETIHRLAQNASIAPGRVATTPYVEQTEAKTPLPPSADQMAKIRALKAENLRLRGQLGREIVEIEMLKSENDQRRTEANNQGRRMSELTERFGYLNRDIGEKDAAIARLNNEQLAKNDRWSKHLAYALVPFTAILLLIATLLVRISKKQNNASNGRMLDDAIQAERERFRLEIDENNRSHQRALAEVRAAHSCEIDQLHLNHGVIFGELEEARRRLESTQREPQPIVRLVPPPKAEGDNDGGQRTSVPHGIVSE